MEALRPEDPRRIGPYQVLARLGSGGMGLVFLGGTAGGRLVAIKVVHVALADDLEFRTRFRREVATAQSVSGAFTAPVVNADPDAARPWLATAFLPGLSLQEAVAGHGPLPPPAIRSLAVGLAEALAAIHRAGVVHRDLKPSNVMLSPDGPRVIDFGVARAADATAVTQTGAVVGSPGYAAPEQVGRGESGPAGDLFSLGAVLAFAATGAGPFGDGEVHAVLHRVVHEPPRLDGVADQRLRQIIAACLSKEPAQRPDTGQLLRWLTAGHSLPPHGTQWLPVPLAADIAHRTTAPLPAPLPTQPGHGRSSRRAVLVGGATAGAAAVVGAVVAQAIRGAGKKSSGPVLWTYAFEDDDRSATGDPIVLDGTLYAVQGDRLWAIDAESGRRRWRADVEVASTPAIRGIPLATAAGVGYVLDWLPLDGPADKQLAAIDLAAGRVLWRRPVNPAPGPGFPAVAAGVVCLPGGSAQPGLVGFDARTGRPRWTYRPGSMAIAAYMVTAAGGVFYYGGNDELLHAVDAATGRKRWTGRLSDYAAEPPVVAGRLVLATTRAHTVHAFDAAGGQPRWQVRVEAARLAAGERNVGGAAPVMANNHVYFGSNTTTIYAFDAASGALRWTYDAGGDEGTYLSPVVSAGTLFVFNRSTQLHAIDTATGKLRWQQPIGTVSRTDRPAIASGLVHMGGDGLVSFDPANGRVVRKVTSDDQGDPMTLVDRVTTDGNVLYFHRGAGEIVAATAR